MLKEFKEFIAQGNVLDLAVGVIIGSAFTAIVNSLVENLINPLIGIFIGGIDFSDWVLKVGDATFKFGTFINSIISFIIIAFIVFLIVKSVNKIMPKKEEEEEVDPQVQLLTDIRDALAPEKAALSDVDPKDLETRVTEDSSAKDQSK
ncbi:large-conductance mechanosensitive channel protein MscL [Ligilactobacillus acidipiscis]|jgi:large conductance mechanosensitive channel|uniref:Large-conductance mechanosensitive channel n=1 Tax=Ligilactobacillus acidipiscis TaxID=89059 RepID=A0A0R2KF29_9LACO|nr:large-conductance mechanosensitive channel protein MscL [Ligilactobacillus acidipiscis]KRN88009.1 large-conductance mechanosensitive channel [Ligilactobacillus acidipiscis]WEV57501.1 large-conductance mechanosensitive channel protein MscL [Ligilactobacillus acidipiscis]SFV39983.1 Large-conductance mechanosensitive channel [Ligilactobacillus acidipiscis]HJE96251.1 large-conductance mechanosensitive channel protein MscL [Ligilactobacillus acidipiscis]